MMMKMSDFIVPLNDEIVMVNANRQIYRLSVIERNFTVYKCMKQ